MQIGPARFPAEADTVRDLMRAYLDGLGIDLDFQGVEAELADLPGHYRAPLGAVLLARGAADGADGAVAGMVAMRPLAPGLAEMKRLYIRPRFRGQGLGQHLVTAIIAAARAAGHRAMRLDTLADMGPALAAYRRAGFRPTGNYNANPLPDARHFELQL